MKIKILSPLFIATMMVTLFSCHEDEQQLKPVAGNDHSNVKATRDSRSGNSSVSLLSTTSSHFTDWSGQVHIEITMEETGLAGWHQNVSVPVPADYVLVGGGAWVNNADMVNAGALLTESRPDEDLQQWWAGSKDHVDPDAHSLIVYSIGLRIDGIDRTTLMNYIFADHTTSGTTSAPGTSMGVPYPYTLIGGGAEVNWSTKGSLIVQSYPNGTQWTVKSKDHIQAEATSITAYAIGIQEYIPGFGYLDVDIFSGSTTVLGGYQTADLSLPYGYALACPGVKEVFNPAAGRLITGIYPDGNYVQVASKDHKRGNISQLQAYAIGIRKRP
jgi:hypothetical protein